MRASSTLVGTALVVVGCAADPGSPAPTVILGFDAEVATAIEDAWRASRPGSASGAYHAVVFERREAADVLDALTRGQSVGDVWWGAEVHDLAAADRVGALRASTPAWALADTAGAGGGSDAGDAARADADAIDADGTVADDADSWPVRSGTGTWWGVDATAVVLVFDPAAVSRGRAPRAWSDLAHFRWNGELILPKSESETARAFVDAVMLGQLRRAGTESAGVDWLGRLDGAVRVQADDPRDQLRRLRIGEGSLTLMPERWLRDGVTNGKAGDPTGLATRRMEDVVPRIVRGIALLARDRDAADLDATADRNDPTDRADAVVQTFLDWVGSPVARATVREAGGWEAVGSADRSVFATDTVVERSAVWLQAWERTVRTRGQGIP